MVTEVLVPEASPPHWSNFQPDAGEAVIVYLSAIFKASSAGADAATQGTASLCLTTLSFNNSPECSLHISLFCYLREKRSLLSYLDKSFAMD